VSLFVPDANWWPGELGVPSSSGAQNDLRYGFFPATRRLAVDIGGALTVYHTGDHVISGVSQQQGGDRTLSFTSQLGLVRLADLPVVSGAGAVEPAVVPAPAPEGGSSVTSEALPASAPKPAAAGLAQTAPVDAPVDAGSGEADVFAKLERVADLHARGILSDAEFEAKKTELLARI
jgi:hypothetical protein